MKEKTKKGLLFSGIFGPIAFVLNDIIGTSITSGYSPVVMIVPLLI